MTEPEVRFLVSGGPVRSRHDGDWHRVSAVRVADLYGLPRGAWREYNENTDRHTLLPILGPDWTGKYQLPEGAGC